jgi:hypothetical protein
VRFDSLQDVFEDQLGDLYDAEKQLVEALPKVAAAAYSDQLREAISNLAGDSWPCATARVDHRPGGFGGSHGTL